ncbi:MAG: hypothetical protein WC764_00375 [Candidatus Paceibacterota bacterium]|jgi:hypothetical protein
MANLFGAVSMILLGISGFAAGVSVMDHAGGAEFINAISSRAWFWEVITLTFFIMGAFLHVIALNEMLKPRGR